MNKWLLLLGLICLLLCCMEDESFYPVEVEFLVTGTQGIPFNGTIGNRSSTTSIQGTTPESYFVELENEFDMVKGEFHKGTEAGTLSVEIYVNNDYKKEASTWAPYGSVSISYSE